MATNLNINSSVVSNNGSIYGEKELNINANSLTNSNTIGGGRGILNIKDSIINNIKGKFNFKESLNASSSLVQNYGEIYGNSILFTSDKFTNFKNATLFGNSINLQTQSFTNNGEVSTEKELDIISSSNILNEGKVVSKGDLNLEGNVITNKHIISGNKTKITALDKIINDTKAIIFGENNLELYAKNSIANQRDGELYSRNDLIIGGINGGKLATLNNNTGKIYAKNDLTIKANQVNNKGTDNFGSNGGYDIIRENVSSDYGRYSWKVIWREKATSTLTTTNAKITGGGNVTIEGNVLNHGGDIISGKDMRITGNVENKVTTFETKPLKEFWKTVYKKCNWHGLQCENRKEERIQSNVVTLTSLTASKISAGGNLTITGDKVSNATGLAIFETGTANFQDNGVSIAKPEGIDITKPSLDLSSLESLMFEDSINKPQISITSINGTGINFTFLKETRPDFASKDEFLSSTYFLEKIPFEGEMTITLLGDKDVEREYITNQIIQSGALNLLADNGIDDLYTQGLDWFLENQGEMNLQFGVSLTAEQVAALSTDIILPVYNEINGEQVLVPELFLSANTLSSISDINAIGGVISSGGDLSISASNNITNGGFISSAGSSEIVSGGDYIGQGGSIITGENLSINAGGNVLLDANIQTTGANSSTGEANTAIVGTSSLLSGGATSITAGDEINLHGATILAGGGASLTAENNILIGGATSQTSLGKEGDNLTFKEQIGIASTINAGKGDLNLTSNNGSVTVASAMSSQTFHSKQENDGGWFGKKETTITDTHKEVNTSSNLIGGNININSQKDTNIIASNLIAKEDVNITTEEGNINIIHSANKDASKREETSKGMLSSSIDIVAHDNTTIVSSNIISNGGDVNLNSGKDILISASNLSGQNGDLTSQGDVNIISALEVMKDINYHKEQSVSLGAVVVGALAAASGVGLAVGVSLLPVMQTINAGLGMYLGAAGTGAIIGSQAQKGELDKYTHTETTHISSNLTFQDSLNINAQDNVNLVVSNISANKEINIDSDNFNNISGINTNTTDHEKQTMKPNYENVSIISMGVGILSGVIPTILDKLQIATNTAGQTATQVATVTGATASAINDKDSQDITKPIELKPVRPIIDSPIYQGIHNLVWSNITSIIEGKDDTALQDTAALLGASLLFPNLEEDEDGSTNSSGSGINIGINIPKPPIYGDKDSGFSLISDDVFDINKPFDSTWINNVKTDKIENKDEKTEVHSQITTNKLTINQKNEDK